MTNPGPRTIPAPEITTTDSDDDAVAHIVTKDQQMKGYVEGKPIKALCGKVWVPTRDFEGLPVCQACAAERDRRVAGFRNLN